VGIAKEEEPNQTKDYENRLARECENLDKNEERKFADLGLLTEVSDWEEY
jgi:hypothetical protein